MPLYERLLTKDTMFILNHHNSPLMSWISYNNNHLKSKIKNSSLFLFESFWYPLFMRLCFIGNVRPEMRSVTLSQFMWERTLGRRGEWHDLELNTFPFSFVNNFGVFTFLVFGVLYSTVGIFRLMIIFSLRTFCSREQRSKEAWVKRTWLKKMAKELDSTFSPIFPWPM